MSGIFVFVETSLFVGLALLLAVGIVAWHRRSGRGVRQLLMLLFFVMLTVASYLLEVVATSQKWLLLYHQLQSVSMVTVPVVLFFITWRNYSRLRAPTRWTYAGILTIPIITLVLIFTDRYHDLYWIGFEVEYSQGFALVSHERGPWMWVDMLYTSGLGFACLGLLLQGLQIFPAFYRPRIAVMITGVLVSVTSILLGYHEFTVSGIEVVPYGFILTAAAVAVGVFHFREIDILPAAREAILQGMQDGVIVLDRNNNVIDLNAFVANLLQLDASEVIGLPSREVLGRWRHTLSRHLDTSDFATDVEIVVHGERRYFDMQISPLHEAGELVGSVIVLRDVTARMKMQEKLEAQNQRLEILRQMNGDLTRKMDLDYVITMALDGLKRLSNADVVLIGLSDTNSQKVRLVDGLGPIPPDSKGQMFCCDNKNVRQALQQKSISCVRDFTDLSGAPIVDTMNAQVAIPLIAGAQLVGAIVLEAQNQDVFSEDVLESVRMLSTHVALALENAQVYHALERAVDDLEAFAHTVAHNLKNPLSVIMGYSELTLRDYEYFDDDRKAHFKKILWSAEKGATIIDSLLLLSGIRALETVDVESLDMAMIIDQVISRQQELVEQHEAKVLLPEVWPVAVGYAPWVEEIWVNYFNNALKYGGRPAVVELGFDEIDNGMVRLWVRDNGPGLKPEQCQKVFQPFTRMHTGLAKGHGLGLSIVQRIAERLGGTVGVESEPGKGSKFYFTLPANEVELTKLIPVLAEPA